MLERLCQLKSLLLLLLLVGSCGVFKSKKKTEIPNELISMFHARWFKAGEEHTLVAQNGNPPPHLFFDVNPEFSMDKRLVNILVTTPQDSEHKYQLDTLSGQRHYAYSYCKKTKPVYSIGHIPRLLDQLGTPQKVILFANSKKVNSLFNYNYFRVKLVGAYVERSCPEGDCVSNKNWLSRMVFLAVDAEDKYYDDVNELADLTKMVDWKEIRTNLETIDGLNTAGLRDYPYIKVGNPITFNEAFDFFKKHSIFMSENEIKKVRKSCISLYEKLWTDVGAERPEDRPVHSMEELSAKVKLREGLRAQKLPVGFAERFRAFTVKYYDESTTCSKFVYAGNLNKNPEKFWFLNYVQLFYRLHKEGFYFDCHHQSWQRNILDNRGKAVYNIKDGIEKCDGKDIDVAIAYISNFLEGIKSESDEYYRFIDYDNHYFGTHNKLYSWVQIPSKKFECKDNNNEEIRKQMMVYPDDAKWKERKIKDYESEMKIIY